MINIKKFVKNAIIEDNGRGDLFFDVAPKGRFTARAISKSDGILAGVQYAKVLARTEKFDCQFLKQDGDEIKAGDVIAVHEGAKQQLRIKNAIELATQRGIPSWIEIDHSKFEGTFKAAPDRSDLPAEINESLIVELYSK